MAKVDGPTERGEVVRELKGNDSFRRTEQAIRSLLVILFVGLLLLKWFQPPSVTLYFSSVLQDLHTQFRRGRFDGWIKPEQRHDAETGGMTPFEFSRWVLTEYRRTSREAEATAEAAEYRAALKRIEDDHNLRSEKLQAEKRGVELELAPVQRRLDDLLGQKEKLTRELRQAGAEEAEARCCLDDLEGCRTELWKQLNDPELPADSYIPLGRRLASLADQIREVSSTHSRSTGVIRETKASIERAQTQESASLTDLREKRSRLQSLDDLISSERAKYLKQVAGVWTESATAERRKRA